MGSAPSVLVGHNGSESLAPALDRWSQTCPVDEAGLFCWRCCGNGLDRPLRGNPQRKFVGHLSHTQVKTIRVKTTASTPEASSVDFDFRASAGLLFDTQSVPDHRRVGVQHPEASSILGTAPELRRTSTTSARPDAAAEVRTHSPRPHARKSCSSHGDIRSSSLTVTPPTKKRTSTVHRHKRLPRDLAWYWSATRAPHPRDPQQR